MMFNSDKTIGIMAQKEAQAKEILDRIKMMYEYLPKWLQIPAVSWNKKTITLGNGSGAFISATTIDGIRGKTCVTGDSIIKIKDVINNRLLTMKIEQLAKNLQDISKRAKNPINPYQVLTPEGYKPFNGVKIETSQVVEVKFYDNSTIRATYDHQFFDSNGKWIQVKNLTIGTKLKCESGYKEVVQLSKVNGTFKVYDLLNVEKTHSYFTNDVLSHNCQLVYVDEFSHIPRNIQEGFWASTYPTISSGENTKFIISTTPKGMDMFYRLWEESIANRNEFVTVSASWRDLPGRDDDWKRKQIEILGSVELFNQEYECHFLGSANTLINGDALKALYRKEPVYQNGALYIYEEPIKYHKYFVSVDCSEGINQDYHVINVIDMTEIPYKQVCVFRSNSLRPHEMPRYIYNICRNYNDAHLLIEGNSTGDKISDQLAGEFNYENHLTTKHVISKGQSLEGPNYSASNKYNRSVRMTAKVKYHGCNALKTLIESKKLIVYDAATILELRNFVSDGRSWAADGGYHDDCVMALVLFGWATTELYFRYLSDEKLKTVLDKEAEDNVRIDMSYMPIFDPNVYVDYTDEKLLLMKPKTVVRGDIDKFIYDYSETEGMNSYDSNLWNF